MSEASTSNASLIKPIMDALEPEHGWWKDETPIVLWTTGTRLLNLGMALEEVTDLLALLVSTFDAEYGC